MKDVSIAQVDRDSNACLRKKGYSYIMNLLLLLFMVAWSYHDGALATPGEHINLLLTSSGREFIIYYKDRLC